MYMPRRETILRGVVLQKVGGAVTLQVQMSNLTLDVESPML